MVVAESTVEIRTPARYMGRLCNHFAHRCTVTRGDEHSVVEFPGSARCLLDAGADTLKLRIDAPDAATLERLQDVVARHLKQVAAHETFEVEWSEAS